MNGLKKILMTGAILWITAGCTSTAPGVVVVKSGPAGVHTVVKAGRSMLVFHNMENHRVKIHLRIKDRTNGKPSLIIVKNGKGERVEIIKIKNGQKLTTPIIVPPGGKVILRCNGWRGACDYRVVKGFKLTKTYKNMLC